jgi:NAD(P)-dependent dehydrogenase (short-subunit alcohol dehydrogenase family)
VTDLDGKVALVTGGGSGIGAATVELLRARGAVVVAGDLENGDVHLDVTDEDSVDAAVARVVDRHGRLDLAANVAGTSGTYATVADADLAAWRHTMSINLDGVFLSLRAELRAGATAIVNVASSAGRMGVPGMGAYCASKHGVIGLTRTVALENARRGVRVNCVCPGSTRTPMLSAFVGGDEDALEGMGRRAPMGRLGSPAEIAEAIVWLLSDAASYLTGSVIEADGGVSAA